MTAIVGVLNKHAVAIAADSAATINGVLGRKVLNQATKIVTLSKYHPVAVMIYSSSSFLGTPWDVIVKLYRDRLGDNDFNSVSDYISDFIQFLTDNHFFSSDTLQKKHLRFQLFKFYQDVEERSIAQIGGKVTDSSKSYLFNSAAICPFAQTDVMETILTGIDPSVKNFISELFSKSLKAYSGLVSNTIKISNQNTVLSTAIENIDISGIKKVFDDAIDDAIGKQYIAPLVDTVAYLEKEDMADMAESLVSLTFLKRRMMSSEESVGGPVDVAIISKSDGFVWIKRKHYFQKELNHQFFSNYYKK